MDKKTVESSIFLAAIIISILIFLWFPAQAESSFDVRLNHVLDVFLFGDGYYAPSNYPFAAKVSNNLSILLMAIGGILTGILRSGDFAMPDSETLSKPYLLFIVLSLSVFTVFSIWISVVPQEFKTPSGRSFGLTESFHNNAFWFLFLMLSKGVIVFAWFRVMIPLALYALKKSKRYERSPENKSRRKE